MTWTLIAADCVEAMRDMDAESIDAVVTDPPYGLEFMGKEWDRLGAGVELVEEGMDRSHPFRDGTRRIRFGESAASMQAWHQTWAAEALRVLKPGGHLLSFGGTRTYHRLVCALEDAGFEIRDCLAWLYGSGFPKSLDVSKAIDKAAGAAREVVGTRPGGKGIASGQGNYGGGTSVYAPETDLTAPATPDAERWQGWGTALKPAFEPIVLARKPLSGTVAENVLRHGVGALNVDGTRIGTDDVLVENMDRKNINGAGRAWSSDEVSSTMHKRTGIWENTRGRWPANVLLDPDAAAALPESRFFYTAKTSRSERENGVAQYGEIEERPSAERHHYDGLSDPRMDHEQNRSRAANNHPTVKPVDLMQWLCRLITPPQGVILDPFTGSGSTGIAALREGFSFIGIEREPDYVEIARARIIGDAPLWNVSAEI